MELELFVFKYTILHLPTPTLICHFPAHRRTRVWDSAVSPPWLDISLPPKNLAPFADSRPALCAPSSGGFINRSKEVAHPNLGRVCWPLSTQEVPGKSSSLLTISTPGTVPLRCPLPLQSPPGSLTESATGLAPCYATQSPMLWGSGLLGFWEMHSAFPAGSESETHQSPGPRSP